MRVWFVVCVLRIFFGDPSLNKKVSWRPGMDRDGEHPVKHHSNEDGRMKRESAGQMKPRFKKRAHSGVSGEEVEDDSAEVSISEQVCFRFSSQIDSISSRHARGWPFCMFTCFLFFFVCVSSPILPRIWDLLSSARRQLICVAMEVRSGLEQIDLRSYFHQETRRGEILSPHHTILNSHTPKHLFLKPIPNIRSS